MSKKLLITLGVVVLIVIIIYNLFGGSYNNMVEKQEAVTSSWSQVQNVYQRRADLIPNLVNTVKGYASHEKSTLEGVVQARAKATSININPDKLDAESLKKYQQAQDGLSSALGKLLMITENYPDLKANQGFLELQSQLEGTENRITVERQRFNESVQIFNTYIRKFPQTMLAGMYGFEKKGYFEADATAQKAVEVKF